MAEETTKVEETTEQDATVETNEVDYDKELEEAAKATHNEIGYEMRHKNKDVAVEEDEDDDSKPLTKKDLGQVVATLKQAAESSALDIKLDKVAGGNESLKKLVKFHYENSVNPNMDITSRVEAAYAIANKKLVDKTVKEINIAQRNRSQISNVGQGASSETYTKPGQNVLSDKQIAQLKEQHKNWKLPGSADDFIKKTIERLNS